MEETKIAFNVMSIDDSTMTGPIIANFAEGPPEKSFMENDFEFVCTEKGGRLKDNEKLPRMLHAKTSKSIYQSSPVEEDSSISRFLAKSLPFFIFVAYFFKINNFLTGT